MSRLTELTDKIRVVDEDGPTPHTRTLKASISLGYKIDVSEHTMQNPWEAKVARGFVVKQLLYSIMGGAARDFEPLLWEVLSRTSYHGEGFEKAIADLRDWVKVNCNNKPVDVRV